jgi:3-isopropylmalate/(R)-2-methylmalate dehydratase small subunit
MAAFRTTTSRVVTLLVNDIDTDQIIPARFLKGTSKTGLGTKLFNDWRYETDGSPKAAFVLNQPSAKGASVLLAGDNFGCGSSREHAPWALVDFGFRVIISTSFADIFKSNALKNGLLPVAVDAATHQRLAQLVAKDAQVEVTVDLEATTVKLPDGSSATFPVDPFSRKCLIEGVDELGYLQSLEARISAFEAARGG